MFGIYLCILSVVCGSGAGPDPDSRSPVAFELSGVACSWHGVLVQFGPGWRLAKPG